MNDELTMGLDLINNTIDEQTDSLQDEIDKMVTTMSTSGIEPRIGLNKSNAILLEALKCILAKMALSELYIERHAQDPEVKRICLEYIKTYARGRMALMAMDEDINPQSPT